MESAAPVTLHTASRTPNAAPRTPHAAPRMPDSAPLTRRLAPRALHFAPLPLSVRFIDALGDQSVGALFRSWVAIVAIGGVVFWALGWFPAHALRANGAAIPPDAAGFLSALYFSAVTATSVGYGDIVPVGLARVLAIGESVAGLILFGCVISKFVSRRQEQLIGEIHRIAFEDRLGRVRTNLHLVRTEVQATANLCEGLDIAPPVAIARVESIAMVFVGELRAVHDLLYRPQQAPDEPVLEAILASLAAVFQEFKELLRCVEWQRAAQPQALRANLTTMSRLAGEICGDCVPHQFAPALRTWMDQIQRVAREIATLS
jgi:hypothetical protein